MSWSLKLARLRELGVIGTIKYLVKYRVFRAGDLVGEDKFGNRYYESQKGNANIPIAEKAWRDRWVELGPKKTNASQVPPEWHAWLHHTTDKPGQEVAKLAEQRIRLEHHENLTGTKQAYTPPDYILSRFYKKKLPPRATGWGGGHPLDSWTPEKFHQLFLKNSKKGPQNTETPK